MTEIHVVDNALVAERVTRLRDSSTPNHEFRRLLRDLSSILVYEAMRQAPLVPVNVTTPMGPATGARFERPPVVVPVLRAGLGMLDAALELLGDVQVAFVGLRRNESTLVAREYASTLPEDLAGRDTLILDPMLATGGSCVHACELLRAAGASRVDRSVRDRRARGDRASTSLRAGRRRVRGRRRRVARRERVHPAGPRRRRRPPVRPAVSRSLPPESAAGPVVSRVPPESAAGPVVSRVPPESAAGPVVSRVPSASAAGPVSAVA